MLQLLFSSCCFHGICTSFATLAAVAAFGTAVTSAAVGTSVTVTGAIVVVGTSFVQSMLIQSDLIVTSVIMVDLVHLNPQDLLSGHLYRQ
jgi:hypothetical protein